MTNPPELSRAAVLQIEYDPDALARIEDEVAATWVGPQEGRQEVGGILLGTHDGEHLRIIDFEPLPRDPSSGPCFLASKSERAEFAERVRSYETRPGNKGKRVVGWYRSRTSFEKTMSREDLILHERHFPEAWQVALLLHPDDHGGMDARLYLKDPTSAVLPSELVTSVEPLPGAAEEIRARQMAGKPQRSLTATSYRTSANEARGSSGLGSSLLDPLTDFSRLGIWRGRTLAGALAVLAVVPVGAVIYLRSFYGLGVAASPIVLPMEALRLDSSLELKWNPAAVAGANEGQLEIEDGPSHSRMTLNRATLASGHFFYTSRTEVTAFKLHVQPQAGPALEGATMYVGADSVLPADPAFGGGSRPATGQKAPREKETKVKQDTRTEGESARENLPAESATGKEQATFRPPTPAARPARTFDPANGLELPPMVVSQSTPPAGGLILQQGVPQIAAPAIRPASPPPPAPRSSMPATRKAAGKPLEVGGHWTLLPGSTSRSPAVPESVSISVFVSNDTIQGSLDAHYRSEGKKEHMAFTFSGRLSEGSAHGVWVDREGKHGQIEFIQVPGAPNRVEVVWYGGDSKQVFNEIVRKD